MKGVGNKGKGMAPHGKADIGRMMTMMTDMQVEVKVAVDIQVNNLCPNHTKQVQLTKVTRETNGHMSTCRELWIFLMKGNFSFENTSTN